MKILVLDRPGSWHVEDLRRAAAGRFVVDAVSYTGLHVLFEDPVPGQCSESFFFADGRPLQQYDCVLTRALPASTLEQIVFRMDWLGQLARQHGTLIVNPARTVEASVDKYLSLEKMRAAGIPVPACHVSQTAQQAIEFFISAGCDSVVKPIFGSRGRNIVRVQNEGRAVSLFESLAAEGRIIYQQRYIEHGDQDLRLLVVGDQVFGMRRRRPGHWVTNASCGASCSAHVPTEAEQALAIGAARSVDAALAGIDIVYEQAPGRAPESTPIVVEINACPSWKATQSITTANIAQTLLDYLFKHAKRQ